MVDGIKREVRTSIHSVQYFHLKHIKGIEQKLMLLQNPGKIEGWKTYYRHMEAIQKLVQAGFGAN